MSDEVINWSADSMLEVTIKQPDDFLKIRETLTRIGVASRKDKTHGFDLNTMNVELYYNVGRI